jgi:hypothetical protein
MDPASDPRPAKVATLVDVAHTSCERAARLAAEIPEAIPEPARQELSALCIRLSALYHTIAGGLTI